MANLNGEVKSTLSTIAISNPANVVALAQVETEVLEMAA